MDQRTTRHAGYEVSQRKRKRGEQSFGWMKMVGMLKKVKLRGIDKVGWPFTFAAAAYNLCRLRNLMAEHDTKCCFGPVQRLERPANRFFSSPENIKFRAKGYSNADSSTSC